MMMETRVLKKLRNRMVVRTLDLPTTDMPNPIIEILETVSDELLIRAESTVVLEILGERLIQAESTGEMPGYD
jgi:hypothetical protein